MKTMKRTAVAAGLSRDSSLEAKARRLTSGPLTIAIPDQSDSDETVVVDKSSLLLTPVKEDELLDVNHNNFESYTEPCYDERSEAPEVEEDLATSMSRRLREHARSEEEADWAEQLENVDYDFFFGDEASFPHRARTLVDIRHLLFPSGRRKAAEYTGGLPPMVMDLRATKREEDPAPADLDLAGVPAEARARLAPVAEVSFSDAYRDRPRMAASRVGAEAGHKPGRRPKLQKWLLGR